jgi:FkbM family methyltransferase
LGEPYDIYEFVRKNIVDGHSFDLVVVTISLMQFNLPYNLEAFQCPTVAIILDTHHSYSQSIEDILTYLQLEKYDYLCFPYCRQHMHWFYAYGFENLGWLPLMTMTTFPHEFIRERAAKAVFVCGDPYLHPYRGRIIDAVRDAEKELPCAFEVGTYNRSASAKIYASSLISLNCSLNGDLNLRNLEVVSAGGFLLADKISPQSGFNKLLKPGEDCDVYSCEEELVEKISWYLNHPEEAISMAHNAYTKFYESLHPNYRINDLYRWIFEGNSSGLFLTDYDSRFEISRQYAELLEVRLKVYQQIQQLHRLRDKIYVLVAEDCPMIFAIDLVDLSRAIVYVHRQTEEKLQIVENAGVGLQVQWIDNLDSDNNIEWDVYIFTEKSVLVQSKFPIRLNENYQIAESSLEKMSILKTLELSSKGGESYYLTYVSDNASEYVLNEIINGCYPVLDFIEDVHVVVDIGANIGLSATHFRISYPDATIYCFEPDPFAFVILQENARKLRNCYAFPIGLYNDVRKEFYIGESSVHSSIHAHSLASRCVTIELKKADKFLLENNIRHIDILKIDTEGREVEILRSIMNCDFQIKVIYLKFYSEEDRRLIDQLLASKYLLWQGSIISAHRGNLCYVRRGLSPKPVSGMEELR